MGKAVCLLGAKEISLMVSLLDWRVVKLLLMAHTVVVPYAASHSKANSKRSRGCLGLTPVDTSASISCWVTLATGHCRAHLVQGGALMGVLSPWL